MKPVNIISNRATFDSIKSLEQEEESLDEPCKYLLEESARMDMH
jgi:hypothetical protein